MLLAEDDSAFRALLVKAFKDDGFEVVPVENGAQLLELLATSLLPRSTLAPFDLVVSDLKMPGWTGLPSLEALCRSRMVPPVLVITAFGNEDVHARAKSAGAAAVVDKPFDLAELTKLGRHVLSERTHQE